MDYQMTCGFSPAAELLLCNYYPFVSVVGWIIASR